MHPCCNGSLQRGVKIIGYVQLVLSIFAIIGGIFVLTALGILALHETENIQNDNSTQSDEELFVIVTVPRSHFILWGTYVIVFGVISVLLSVLLLFGAYQRNQKLCIVWFVINILMLIFSAIATLYRMVQGDALQNIVISVIEIILKSYFLWVVYAFIEELKMNERTAPATHVKPRV